jgi:hypothetical protein
MNFLSFSASNPIGIGKQAIRTLLLSIVFLSVPIASSQACPYQNSQALLLNKAPKKLHGASFMGKVELTRVTNINGKTIVRAIVQESETHPHFIGKKMAFFYNSFFNLCGSPSIPIRIGSQGFAIGSALKLGSEILYVEPYTIQEFLWATDVLIESESIPLSEFY